MATNSVFACFVVLVGIYLCQSDPINPNLKLVATVNGKSFFADRSVERNWTTAGAYCQSLGMNLATISKKEETDALANAYDADYFNTNYWTSARDAQLRRQFTWNTTGDELGDQVPVFVPQLSLAYLTCVGYAALSNPNNSGLLFWPCSNTLGTLCET